MKRKCVRRRRRFLLSLRLGRLRRIERVAAPKKKTVSRLGLNGELSQLMKRKCERRFILTEILSFLVLLLWRAELSGRRKSPIGSFQLSLFEGPQIETGAF